MENFINAVQDALCAQINEAASLRSQLSDDTDRELIEQWSDIQAILTRAHAELTGELVTICKREGR
jgi:hypothetical protein